MKTAEACTPRVPEKIRKIVNGWPPLDEMKKARIAGLLRNHNN